jgi:hypothetical protein
MTFFAQKDSEMDIEKVKEEPIQGSEVIPPPSTSPSTSPPSLTLSPSSSTIASDVLSLEEFQIYCLFFEQKTFQVCYFYYYSKQFSI